MLLALLLAPLAAPQQTPPAPAVPVEVVKPYKLNLRTEEELTLPDLDGKAHALYAAHPNQPIVLVFWGYKDPVSLHYAPLLAELARAHAGKAGFYLVDSNHDELVSGGDALGKLREVLAREKVTLPVLIDHDQRLADDFGATANGQAFLLDGNKFLRYHGGIDDDPRGERARDKIEVRPWLANALGQVLAGERPKENWTRPAGRPIKRAPKAGVPAGAPRK
ncbi:MAG TPA: redoxin domain-containing protein [Planctomycetota bacterium]